MRAELQASSEPSDIPAQMNETTSLRELQYTIKKLKVNTSPGTDEINNKMIINFELPARTKLLEIYNQG